MPCWTLQQGAGYEVPGEHGQVGLACVALMHQAPQLVQPDATALTPGLKGWQLPCSKDKLRAYGTQACMHHAKLHFRYFALVAYFQVGGAAAVASATGQLQAMQSLQGLHCATGKAPHQCGYRSVCSNPQNCFQVISSAFRLAHAKTLFMDVAG